MPSPGSDARLDRDRVLAAMAEHPLLAAWLPGERVSVVATTGSTNADLMAAAAAGAPEGTVVVAGEQRQGRGRLQRDWASPPGGSLSLSVLLRPTPRPSTWGWLPLLTGVAALSALREVARSGSFAPELKWPNDVLARAPGEGRHGQGKLAGILVERAAGVSPAVVVGVGVNVALDPADLPVPTATSLQAQLGVAPEREELAARLVARVAERYLQWSDRDGDAIACGLHADYVRGCATLGRRVRLEQPQGARHGCAVGIDSCGRLLLEADDGTVSAVSSGEVVHVR